VSFEEVRRSAATGEVARSFVLGAFDGDLYLVETPHEVQALSMS
jgi:hypothetical protein